MKIMKRKRGDEDGEVGADTAPTSDGLTIGKMTSHIRNKQVRSTRYQALKKAELKNKRAARDKKRKEMAEAVKSGAPLPVRPQPKTIESTREADETIVQPDDEEVAQDEQDDEYADHFNRTREPHVLLTTCTRPSVSSLSFVKTLLGVLPCATYYRRGGFALKKIVEYARNRDFSDLIVVNEDRRVVNGLLISHLPQGPTALFRLSNLRMPAKIKGSVPPNTLRPELVLNNFSTRLGLRVGRMLASLFHQDPAFRGRRVATFHNQRDFIFFRHHLYEFKQQSEEEVKAERALAKRRAKQGKAPLAEKSHVQARLREIGPRFTLRLQSLQAGTMDSLTGEYEWMQKKEQDTSRRRFQL